MRGQIRFTIIFELNAEMIYQYLHLLPDSSNKTNPARTIRNDNLFDGPPHTNIYFVHVNIFNDLKKIMYIKSMIIYINNDIYLNHVSKYLHICGCPSNNLFFWAQSRWKARPAID